MVKTQTINVKTRGNCDVVDISGPVRQAVAQAGLSNGVATLFIVGSTGGITTVEYEPGLVNHDLAAAFERLAPQSAVYEHEKTWHDDNGHAHVRASLLGPSLTAPFIDRRLQLGTWQQIVLIDFDTRPRSRQIVVQVVGE